EEQKRFYLYWIPSSFLIILGIFLFRYFGISVERAIVFPSSLFSGFFDAASKAGSVSAFYAMVSSLVPFFLPLVPIVAGFSITVAYGALHGEDRRLGLSTGVSGVFALFFFNFTLSSLLFAAAIMACCILSTGLGFTFFQELQKWKPYRTGTYSVGRMLLIVNILVALSVFVSATTNLHHYEDVYKQQARDTISKFGTSLFLGNVPLSEMSDTDLIDTLSSVYPAFREEYDKMPKQDKQALLKQYRENIGKQSELMGAQINPQVDKILNSDVSKIAMDFSIIMSTFFIFGALETLKSLILCPIAGFVTSMLLSRRGGLTI
ncbi:MAG: hypothetical protein HZB68_05595, partial [Candidatus Aenigmarchaeota archaeon]|nr:hypothetical protein [Candidatus Aenigmarchaeota archaeon]